MKPHYTPFSKALLPSLILLALSGCGGSSSDSSDANSTETTTKSLTITAVDPYISEAEFYIDLNNNQQYDAGSDPLSTKGSHAGEYLFENYIPEGDVNILAKNNGKHNGVDYQIGLQGTVAANSETAILNPATTATNALSISTTELVAILNQTFTNEIGATLTESDLLSDPVDGLLTKPIADLTASDIAKIRTQVVLTGLQRIMQGSTEIQKLTDTQFILAATKGQTTHNIIYNIIDGLVTGAAKGIKQSNIDGFTSDSGYQTVLSYGGPTIKTQQFLNTAITILNRITEAGYTACNDYNQSLNGAAWNADDNAQAIHNAIGPLFDQIGSWSTQLGPRYYAATYQTTISDLTYGSQVMAGMNQNAHLKAGFDCASKYFEINTDNNVVCVSQ